MQKKSNRTILRQLHKTTYKILRQTHDLERGGKMRALILSKTIDNQAPIILMLKHTKKLVTTTLETIENERAKTQVESYFSKFNYYEAMIKNNCSSKKPLQKKIVSCMLTTQTRLYNYLLNEDLKPYEITPIDVDELSKMILSAVIAWNNNFRRNS